MKNFIREKDAAELIKALQLQTIHGDGESDLKIVIDSGLHQGENQSKTAMVMHIPETSQMYEGGKLGFLPSKTIEAIQEAEYFAAIFNLTELYIDADTIDLNTFPLAAVRYEPDTPESRTLRNYANEQNYEALKNWIRKRVYCR